MQIGLTATVAEPCVPRSNSTSRLRVQDNLDGQQSCGTVDFFGIPVDIPTIVSLAVARLTRLRLESTKISNLAFARNRH